MSIKTLKEGNLNETQQNNKKITSSSYEFITCYNINNHKWCCNKG